jgi:PAS domain S-box-containing protein
VGTTVVAILSIVIQIAAAGLTAPLVRLTRPRWLWVSFGAAIALLAVVRAVTLIRVAPSDPVTEALYLLISGLILTGVLGMRPLFRAYHNSVDRLRNVQREIDAARKRLGYVLDSAPIIVFAVDEDGIFTLSEGRGLAGLGLKPGEVVGLSAFDVYKDNPDIISSIRRSLAGEDVTAPIDVIDLSYEVHYSPIRDDRGNIAGVFGVAVDVSRRRRSETQLRATKERFRALVETTSDLVWEIDPDGVYTYVGPKVKELLGYEPDELIGKTPFDLMAPEDAARRRDELRQLSAERLPFAGSVNSGRHKSGRVVVLETSGVPVVDDDGTLVGYRGIDRDITTRKEAEEALRASEQRLNLALVAANMGTWDWNIETNRVNWSQKVEELSAIEKGSFDGKYETYLSLIHPEDRDHVQFAANAAPAAPGEGNCPKVLRYRRRNHVGDRHKRDHRADQPHGNRDSGLRGRRHRR